MKPSPISRRAPLRVTASLRRRVRLRPGRRPGSGVNRAVWRADLGECVVCPAEGGTCAGPVQAHHIIAAATLRKLGFQAHLSDVRNRLAVCEFRHEQHTTRYRPIGRELLPASVFEFAAELGLGWYVDRYYGVTRRAA